MNEDYYLLAFASSQQAIAAHKQLRDLGAAIMPVLRQISASCGIALRLPLDQAERAQRRLSAADIGGWTMYAVRHDAAGISCRPAADAAALASMEQR